jgi:hypothetical protein
MQTKPAGGATLEGAARIVASNFSFWLGEDSLPHGEGGNGTEISLVNWKVGRTFSPEFSTDDGEAKLSYGRPGSMKRLIKSLAGYSPLDPIGSSRETVTRLLNDFKRKRIVEVSGASIRILDRLALEALALAS